MSLSVYISHARIDIDMRAKASPVIRNMTTDSTNSIQASSAYSNKLRKAEKSCIINFFLTTPVCLLCYLFMDQALFMDNDCMATTTFPRPDNHCELQQPSRKRKCPQSPPLLDLGGSAVLRKGWEFVSEVEEAAYGRTLAQPSGSKLEAQLLVSLIESMTEEEEEDTNKLSPACLERSISGIEPLPETVPGVSEQEWDEFKRLVFE